METTAEIETEKEVEVFPQNVFDFLSKCNETVLTDTLRAAESKYSNLPRGVDQRTGFMELSRNGEIQFTNMYLHRLFQEVSCMCSKALFQGEFTEGMGWVKANKFIRGYLGVKDENKARGYHSGRISIELLKIAISNKNKNHAKS